MGYQSECPLCHDAVADGAACECGYLKLTASGVALTRQHGTADAYHVEPNVLVTEVANATEVTNDPAERGPAPKRRGAGSPPTPPDDPLPGDGEMDGDGGEDRLD